MMQAPAIRCASSITDSPDGGTDGRCRLWWWWSGKAGSGESQHGDGHTQVGHALAIGGWGLVDYLMGFEMHAFEIRRAE